MLTSVRVVVVTGLLQDTAWAIKRIQSRHLQALGAALEPLGVTLVSRTRSGRCISTFTRRFMTSPSSPTSQTRHRNTDNAMVARV